MKRRSFLGFLGLAAPAAAVGSMVPPDEKGIWWRPTCFNCGRKLEHFFDLTKPLFSGGPQCPSCLMTLPFEDDLAERIKEWNLAHNVPTTIWTPRRL